jgi:leader peptidase (prepilin peptidase)/N-methyltransferase
MAALPRSRRDSYGIGHFCANRRAALSWLLVAVLAVAGLLIGWCLRAVVVPVAVPAGQPLRTGCPECGCRIAVPGRPLRVRKPAAAARSGRPHGADSAASATPPPTRPPAASRWRLLAWFSAGRCPACRARVGPPPLLLELTTAVLFGALAARVHPGLVLAAACWLATWAVALGWIDAAVQRLPDLLTSTAYAGTAGFLLLAAAAGGQWGHLLRAFVGGLALAAAYLVLVLVSRSAIGLGDAKLAASLGTLLAWSSWPTLIAGTFAGFLLAAVYGLGLLVTRRATLRQRIPFGPFMIAGAFLALLAGAAT